MIKTILLKRLFFVLLSFTVVSHSKAQCTTANINWDNLDYLVTSGNYSGFVSSAMALTQNFAIGTNRLTIAVQNSNITLNGENTSHTGEAGSYGTGADISYSTTSSSARTITLTFKDEVSSFKTSLYDLDQSQKVTITAKNAANASKTVTLSKPSGGTVVLAANPGNTPTGTGNSSNYSNNSTTGTLNIDIAGPVKTITLSFNNAAGDFWLSDISACVTGSYPNNYYLVAKPFAGQAGYVLTVRDNDVYYTNTANGVSKLLFTDPGTANLNSLAYDPYKGYVYYTYSLTGNPQTDKALKKYDVNTGTISTVLADITSLGIPTFEYGVESGGAAFYNGQLFLGIEGYADDFEGGRKSIIWRLDFTGAVPTSATQVYASIADDGDGEVVHDWSDFGISNGILYDFDGASDDEDFYKYNMQTGALTNYSPASGVTPRQVAIGWDEKIYNVDASIGLYNGTNNVSGEHTITSTPSIPGGGSWGDAGEAFRPFVDFGDAPATFDPSGVDPAVHETSPATLRIGSSINTEAAKRGITSAEDNYDDGISTIAFLLPGTSRYLVQVSVFNNTGSNATLCAWLDYNGNGVFNSGEGISQTISSSPSMQAKYLYWPSVTTPISNGGYTYLRVRITSAANGMTVNNPNGYYLNGEVEDYRVPVDNYPLPVTLLSFDAKKTTGNYVKLTWSANEETSLSGYDLQKSTNGTDWTSFTFVNAIHPGVVGNYIYTDDQPYKNISYYRLSMKGIDGENNYSATRSVTISDQQDMISISPNPARAHTLVNVSCNDLPSTAAIKVLNMSGKELYAEKTNFRMANEPFKLYIPDHWLPGMYIIQVIAEGETRTKKLLIAR